LATGENPNQDDDSVHWIPPGPVSLKTSTKYDNNPQIPTDRGDVDHENEFDVHQNKSGTSNRDREEKSEFRDYAATTTAGHKHKSSNFDNKGKIVEFKAKVRKYDENSVKERLRFEVDKCTEMYEIKLGKVKDKFSRQITKLRQENDDYVLKISNLMDLVQHWKGKAEREENQSVVSARLKSCTRENKNLNEDLDVLKTVVYRLNKEISFYQEKLRLQFQAHPSQIPVFSSSSDSNVTPTDFLEGNTGLEEPKKILLPLLKAYDAVIQEKQEIIKDNEVKMERFKLKCQEIVQENETLHKIIGQSKVKGSVSIEEWQFLYDNAILVLEENDLLHDKITVLEKKSVLIHNTHEGKMSKLKTRISVLEDEKTRLINFTNDLEKQCTSFSEQINKMAGIIQLRIPKEEHEASVRECKQLFEDLKRRYGEERTVLTDKLSALEAEKERLVIELTDSDAENAKLQANLHNLETTFLANNERMGELQKKLEESTKSQDTTAETVNEMMELVKTVFAEREAIEASFNEQRTLNEQMMSLRSRESELVRELQNKIEMMSEVHKEEIQEHLNRINDLEEVLKTIGDRQQVDTLQLRELVNEKTAHIDMLQTEKRQLIEDLETVWRATAKDRGDLWSISLPKLSHGIHK